MSKRHVSLLFDLPSKMTEDGTSNWCSHPATLPISECLSNYQTLTTPTSTCSNCASTPTKVLFFVATQMPLLEPKNRICRINPADPTALTTPMRPGVVSSPGSSLTPSRRPPLSSSQASLATPPGSIPVAGFPTFRATSSSALMTLNAPSNVPSLDACWSTQIISHSKSHRLKKCLTKPRLRRDFSALRGIPTTPFAIAATSTTVHAATSSNQRPSRALVLGPTEPPELLPPGRSSPPEAMPTVRSTCPLAPPEPDGSRPPSSSLLKNSLDPPSLLPNGSYSPALNYALSSTPEMTLVVFSAPFDTPTPDSATLKSACVKPVAWLRELSTTPKTSGWFVGTSTLMMTLTAVVAANPSGRPWLTSNAGSGNCPTNHQGPQKT